MKKIVVVMFLVLAFSVGMGLAEDPKPKKVKECVEWTPVKVPIKYVCGTKWVGNIQQDVWCTKYEETVKCTKWADVEGSNHPEFKDTLLASENCVCAECGWKCGTGHAKTCSSYQKYSPDLSAWAWKKVCVEWEQIPTYDKKGNFLGFKKGKCLEWKLMTPDEEKRRNDPLAPRGFQKEESSFLMAKIRVVKKCVQWEQIPTYDSKGNHTGYKKGACIEWETDLIDDGDNRCPPAGGTRGVEKESRAFQE
jgi:hypothetical protein